MIEYIKSGGVSADNIPGFERRIRFANMLSLYHESEESKRYLEHTIPAAAWMKLVEFGGIPYYWKGEGMSFKNFSPINNHEYSFGIVIKSEDDNLSKRQKRYLQLLGFDLEKYDCKRKYKDGEITLIFSMQNYSVNSNPWAHNNWELEESA